MTTSRSVRDHLRTARIRLRPAARRRALLTGLAAGPVSTAGFGFIYVGVTALLSAPSVTSWFFTGIGLLSVIAAGSLAVRLMRPHHRGTRSAVQAVVLVGFPLALIASSIVASIIIALSLELGAAGSEPWVVFPVSWLGLAVPGVVLGPLAMWWTAHMNRFLPTTAVADERTVEKYEATTVAD